MTDADPFLNVDFEPLYYDMDAVMSFLRILPNVRTVEHEVDFHAYWKTVRPFGRKQILPIKSFLATQPPNFHFTLWSNTDLTTNELLRPWLPYITFKLYNPVKEGRYTILEGKPQLQQDDYLVFSGGDLFRALILHKYGGVYVDMDSVFMRSFDPLFGAQFMYKWSFQPTMISSAVMYLYAQSQLSLELLRGIIEIPAGGTNWGCVNNMRAFAVKPFRVLPCAFFNPEWQIRLTPEEKLASPDFAEPFKVNAWTNNMYEGSFIWHWHNRWDEPIQPGCKFEILEKQVEEKLKQLELP